MSKASFVKDDSPRSPAQAALLLIGSLGPIGHLPASGTMAVLIAGVPIGWVMRTYTGTMGYLILVVAFALFAVWLHDVGDRLLGEKDSRKLVLDELPGYWIAVAFAPMTWPMFILAFFLERFIDIAKVPPANIIEKKIPGGWGVVGDDIVAGIYTMLILLAVEHWVPARYWGG